MSVAGLTADEVERFVLNGFVHVTGAFPRKIADQARDLLWSATGCDPHDPATWTRPVIRLPGSPEQLFRTAANTPRLHAAFDQLVGGGRWLPRRGLGTFPIRLAEPVSTPPGRLSAA